MTRRSKSLSSSIAGWSAALFVGTALVATAGAGGCSSSHETGDAGTGTSACSPGDKVPCLCSGGAKGEQSCNSQGTSLGTCDCSGNGTGADGGGGGGKNGDGGRDGSKGKGGADGGGSHTDGSKGGGTKDGAGSDGGACDPVTQTGCPSGEKCAWIRDSTSPSLVDHIGCVPDGSTPLNGTCTYGPNGATTGYDDCKKGLACNADATAGASGTCYAICNTSAESGTGACAADYVCTAFAGFSGAGGASDNEGGADATVGLCNPTCNPLTQTLDYNGAAACGGGTSGGVPTLGCYGDPSSTPAPSTFTCAPNVDPTYTSDTPVTTPGGPYVNSCAPGFAPVFTEGWNSSTVICAALCDPSNTSTSSTANAAGLVGSGHTCPDAGAGGTHECRYWWWLEAQSTAVGPYSNSLGVCFDYTLYKYDSNGNGVIDSGDDNTPSCTTLSSTGHTFSATVTDTQEWGCESITTRPML